MRTVTAWQSREYHICKHFDKSAIHTAFPQKKVTQMFSNKDMEYQWQSEENNERTDSRRKHDNTPQHAINNNQKLNGNAIANTETGYPHGSLALAS